MALFIRTIEIARVRPYQHDLRNPPSRRPADATPIATINRSLPKPNTLACSAPKYSYWTLQLMSDPLNGSLDVYPH
jgi:hypothetical protein